MMSSISVFLPILLAVIFFVSVVRVTIYRPRYQRLEDVILFARKLGVSELETLTDPGEEWGLRNLASGREYHALQGQRYRLIYEYLKRLSHNAAVVQLWGAELYEGIRFKSRELLTEQDYLIWEMVELSTELRMYSMAALVQVWFWIALQMHRWPMRWTPRISCLRVIGSTDIVRKYRQLVRVTSNLAGTYGEKYHDEIIAAL
jgi:hypothetical protein